MKNRLRITLTAFASIAVLTTYAWTGGGHQAVTCLAQDNLTEKARNEVLAILGSDMTEVAAWLNDLRNKPETKSTSKWHYFSLSKDLQSVTEDRSDGMMKIEESVEILRNRNQHSQDENATALKILIHLVGDLHNIAHIRIADVKLSQRTFKIEVSNGKPGKKHASEFATWKKFWDAMFLSIHGGFSPRMFADDMELCYASSKEEWMKGTPREWANDMGKEVRPLFKWAKENYFMTKDHRNRLEPVSYRCMAKGGFRLAAILNDIFK